jgi:DNA-binding CsgD family transcriptional regulator
MALNHKTTWLGYIEKLCNQNLDPQKINLEGIEQMLMINTSFHSLFFHSVPMIYLLDYTTSKYMLMSKATIVTLGFEPKEWTENGISFTIDLYNREDLKIYNEKIFPDRLKFLKSIPPNEHHNYIFSYNYRLKNSKGEYVNLLQRNCFIKSDDKGLPLVSMGVAINIEHYKKENPVIQIVEKVNLDNNSAETVFKKVYYLNEESNIFSKREKEVLLWVTDGLTSKEIAEKLYISEGTVINHRKNMILKSGTKNTSELISFAMKNYII